MSTSTSAAEATSTTATTTNDSTSEWGPSISIFDFDGTLFKSPSPSKHAMAQYPAIDQPYENKGLAWFHNPRSLDPPYVPAGMSSTVGECGVGHFTGFDAYTPSSSSDDTSARATTTTDAQSYYTMTAKDHQKAFDDHMAAFSAAPTSSFSSSAASSATAPDAFHKWFVLPTVAAYMTARKRGDITAILTGRSVSFTGRLRAIVDSAGLYFDHYYLKQHTGTVKFKVNTFLELITTYKPRRIVYYEDRHEQGAKIHKALLTALREAYGGGAASSSATAAPATANNALDDETAATTTNLADYYSSPDNFAIVYLPKGRGYGDTILHPDDEAALIADLLRDKEAAGMTSGNSTTGGGHSGGNNPTKSNSGGNKKGGKR